MPEWIRRPSPGHRESADRPPPPEFIALDLGIIIAKSGEPFARLVSLDVRAPKRQAGTLKGYLEISDEFFEPFPSEWTGEN